jgi:hypothetical protein
MNLLNGFGRKEPLASFAIDPRRNVLKDDNLAIKHGHVGRVLVLE